MNKRIPQCLSAAVLAFLLYALALMVQPDGANGISGGLDSDTIPVTIAFASVVILLGVGIFGLIRAKKWAYTLMISVLTVVSLVSLTISIFVASVLDWILTGGDGGPLPSMEEVATIWAIILFPALVISATVTLILYMRQQNRSTITKK